MTAESPRKRRKKKQKNLFQRASRRLRHGLTVPALNLLRGVLRRLPHGAVLAAGSVLGSLAAGLAPRERKLAERQLIETGVAASPSEAAALARGVFRNLGRNMFEWLHSTGWSDAQLREAVQMTGLEYVASAQAPAQGGRAGLIFVTGHFGNWELMVTAFVRLTAYKLMAAMTEGSNAALHAWIVEMRARDGALVASTAGNGLPMIRHLKGGNMLAVLSDQDTARVRGEFVEFFGRPARTPSGGAFLAWRLGLPIVPVTIERDAANPRTHRMVFHEPILPDPSSPEAEEVPRLTQAFTRVLEQAIRRRPDQWVWIHDRWKHKAG